MINLHQGDLLTAPVGIICHQANCQNTMGSGVAKSIREKFPDAWKADCEAAKSGFNVLGNISVGKDISPSFVNFYIVNIYGQFRYGLDTRHTNYEAVYKGLEKTLEFTKSVGTPPIGFPYKMGSVRGGGDWRIIQKMIEVIFENYNNDVLICKI